GDGPGGASGSQGQKGPDGRASAHAGKAADQFAGLEGITLLDGAVAGVAEAQPAPDPKPGKGKPAKGAPKKKTVPGGGS
ncbi:MAG TPA: hypothetical protein VIJ22_16330, partial [Polyangiaceae bacterium]